MTGQREHKWRKTRNVDKKTSTKGMIKAEKRKESILGLLIIFGVLIVAIAGGWYLLQSPSAEVQKDHQIEILSVSDLLFPNSSIDEHPGTLAPDFSLTDSSGNTSWLSDFKGKVVVIDFMATWCGPCRQEMPHYGAVWEKYEGGGTIVLMSIDIDPRESEETLREFAQGFPYATWIWARDTVNLGQAYQVTAIPKTVIIDQDGYIRFEHVGVTPASTFIMEIDQLLS